MAFEKTKSDVPMKKAGYDRAHFRGFTLLEAILALSLMIALLSGVYGFYANTLRVRHDGGKITRDVMLTRAVLARIINELRHATDILPGDGRGFKGSEDSITIVYVNMPDRHNAFNKYNSIFKDAPPAEMDIRRVSYQLLWDDEFVDDEGVKLCHGLLRSEQKTFDPNPAYVVVEEEPGSDKQQEKKVKKVIESETELFAPEIKYLRFEYFDGAEWHDAWRVAFEEGQEGGGQDEGGVQSEECEDCEQEEGEHVLPQAVRITVGQERVNPEEEFDLNEDEDLEERREREEYHPDRFTVVVYLNQADRTLLSSRKYGASRSLQLGRQEGL
ncbi:MAG: hypothetical protein JSV03_01875 [Planctomycetota bacterium]|nr:MAG: hypothetical protein JSV03_01875 [Planctomycetota bacterium]